MNNPTAISEWIAGLGIWPLVVMLLPNLLVFRKYRNGATRKRMASLYQAIAVFLFCTAATLIASVSGSDIYLIPVVVVIAGASWFLRKRMFPYSRTCPECGHTHALSGDEFKNIYVFDDNLCDECRAKLETTDEPEDS